MRTTLLAALPLLVLLAGCDQLGIETPAQTQARAEAEGKAIGGGCRHAGRALEDCYENNKRASKAAIFSGWRDMDAYMRENRIEVVAPAPAEDEAAPDPKAEAAKPAEAPKAPTTPEQAPPTKDKGSPTAKPAAKKVSAQLPGRRYA